MVCVPIEILKFPSNTRFPAYHHYAKSDILGHLWPVLGWDRLYLPQYLCEKIVFFRAEVFDQGKRSCYVKEERTLSK